MKYLIYSRLTRCRYIADSRTLDLVLILSLVCIQDPFHIITRAHSYLMKGIFAVSLWKNLASSNLIKHLIISWSWCIVSFVTSLRAMRTKTLLSLSPFTKNNSTSYGYLLLQIFPFSNNSKLISLAFLCSAGGSWYKGRWCVFDPCSISILWSKPCF